MTYQELEQYSIQVDPEISEIDMTDRELKAILPIAEALRKEGLEVNIDIAFAGRDESIQSFSQTLKGEINSEQLVVQGINPETHDVQKEMRSIENYYNSETHYVFKPTKELQRGHKEAEKLMEKAYERLRAATRESDPRVLMVKTSWQALQTKSDHEIAEERARLSFREMVASLAADKGIQNIRETLSHTVEALEEYSQTKVSRGEPMPTMQACAYAVVCNPDRPQDILHACEDPSLLASIAYHANMHELAVCGQNRRMEEIGRLATETEFNNIRNAVTMSSHPASRVEALVNLLYETTINHIDQNISQEQQVAHMSEGLIQDKVIEDLKREKSPELLAQVVDFYSNGNRSQKDMTIILDAIGRHPEVIDAFSVENHQLPSTAINQIAAAVHAAESIGMNEQEQEKLANTMASNLFKWTELFQSDIGKVVDQYAYTEPATAVRILTAEDPAHEASIVKATHDLQMMAQKLETATRIAEAEITDALSHIDESMEITFDVDSSAVVEYLNNNEKVTAAIDEMQKIARSIESYLTYTFHDEINEEIEDHSRLSLLAAEPEVAQVIEDAVVPAMSNALSVDYEINQDMLKEMIDLRMELPLDIMPQEYLILYGSQTQESLTDLIKDYAAVREANQPYLDANNQRHEPEQIDMSEFRMKAMLEKLGFEPDSLRSDTAAEVAKDWCIEHDTEHVTEVAREAAMDKMFRIRMNREGPEASEK